MNKTENIVAFGNCGNNNTNCVLVVYLIDVLVSDEYFAVDAVNALYSSVYLRRLSKIFRLETL